MSPLPEPYLSAEVTASLLGPNVREPLFTTEQLHAAVAAERERMRVLVEAVRDANFDAEDGETFRLLKPGQERAWMALLAGLEGPTFEFSEGLGAATLTRWVMHDNHTFTKLPADSDAAYALAMQCFDDDGGWIDLCGAWSDERTSQNRRSRPASLQAHGRETRAAFAEAALKWLHANPSA